MLNVTEQLDAGVRYLDLRIAHMLVGSEKNLHFVHMVYTTVLVEVRVRGRMAAGPPRPHPCPLQTGEGRPPELLARVHVRAGTHTPGPPRFCRRGAPCFPAWFKALQSPPGAVRGALKSIFGVPVTLMPALGTPCPPARPQGVWGRETIPGPHSARPLWDVDAASLLHTRYPLA